MLGVFLFEHNAFTPCKRFDNTMDRNMSVKCKHTLSNKSLVNVQQNVAAFDDESFNGEVLTDVLRLTYFILDHLLQHNRSLHLIGITLGVVCYGLHRLPT